MSRLTKKRMVSINKLALILCFFAGGAHAAPDFSALRAQTGTALVNENGDHVFELSDGRQIKLKTDKAFNAAPKFDYSVKLPAKTNTPTDYRGKRYEIRTNTGKRFYIREQ
ncbi:hypothetical protein HC723_09905 [Vibrio sp. S11_S32]|uniref:hypothetical protein n=1 Tax=Vibrio sp. S11_S32 TaxID=2720225 RepID=UPI00167FE954|nr:hypothetical protein [Vibrio sp. S11_S32]MBD1576750.1 hypothetical protein [Vibrio sp. S11_S32]